MIAVEVLSLKGKHKKGELMLEFIDLVLCMFQSPFDKISEIQEYQVQSDINRLIRTFRDLKATLFPSFFLSIPSFLDHLYWQSKNSNPKKISFYNNTTHYLN